ncbi:MAG: hypothetical protein ACR2NP_03275, partial [Pirellulaceae bacterium]
MSGTPPNPSNHTAAGKSAWLSWFTVQRLALIVIVMASALAMSPNVADPDLWGHVQFGRDVLATGEIAPTTSYSFTAEGYRWINHENLSEIAMALIADSLGPLGLVCGKFCLSLLVIIAVLRWNLRHGSGLIVSAIMTLLVAANLGYHWSIRPQLSSFVCFTLLLLLLQHSFAGWRDRWHWPSPRKWFQQSSLLPEGEGGRRPDEGGLEKQLDLASTNPRSTASSSPAADAATSPQGEVTGSRINIRQALGYDSGRIRLLWLAPLLFFVWANSHGGFVAGLCVFVAYLGCRAVEALFRGGPLNPRNAGWGIVRRMVLMGLVAILATFINPYGPRLHLWLLESLGSPRPEISDWSNHELFTVVGMKLWLLVGVTAFAIIGSRRKLDLTQLIVLFLLLWQSISHFRHVPFFALAAGFWMGPHLQSAMTRLSRAADADEQPSEVVLRLVRCGLAVAIVLVSFNLTQRLTDLQVRRDQFPVDAVDFMRQHNLYGRLVVTYD